MSDNELIKLFLPIIQNGLFLLGYSSILVIQSDQPTQQGIIFGPTVYFKKLGDKRFGWFGVSDVWDEINSKQVRTYLQFYETTFQINALVLQNPSNPLQYTASDLINDVAFIMQNSDTIERLQQFSVGILKVSEVRNPYFKDDRDQFEASPSFDFTLQHKQTRITSVPVIESYESEIQRV